ncbi:hypothetical protein CH371_09610 [Leptospira wolffii]|uniref:Uncharacterized protein n=1 Tax=Leptospira wolffii TaxID=409998 RepID=A0A2M9ZBL0_9LEPT|nr:HEPN domain-containing protein [Leptospira wolffii]PJZ65799.1 hypothetical protein CH371_09610 [Leptospira wolffii]
MKKNLYLIAPLINASEEVLELQKVLHVTIKKYTNREAEVLFYEMSGRDRFYEIGHYFNSVDNNFYILTSKIGGAEIEIADDGYSIQSHSWPGPYLNEAEILKNSINEKISLINVISSGYLKASEYHIVYELSDNYSYKAIAYLGGYLFNTTSEEFKVIHPELLSFIEDFDQNKIPKFLKLAIKHLDQSYQLNGGMAFLSLLIGFEVLFNPGSDQIRYTISRNTAVLIGNSPEESIEIFENMKNAYSLRSSLVHKGEADFKKLLKFNAIMIEYLKRAIARLLGKPIDKDALSSKLTISAFGDSPYPLPYGV